MPTPWLNYHHLLYFWTVAKEGSVTKASKQLRLAQPTISAQLKALEDALGEKLLLREGRGVKLTETGQIVFKYAEEIFNLGRELVHTVQHRPVDGPIEIRIGITDALPKMIAYRLIEPALVGNHPLRVICREGPVEQLVNVMANHELDLVLSDAPVGPQQQVPVFTQLLGECGITFFGVESLWRAHHQGFPHSLDGAPILMPLRSSNLRNGLEHWLRSNEIRPRVTGEFDDSALMMAFGQAGAGIFAMPGVLEGEITKRFDLRVLGRAEQLKFSCHAITVERKVTHPAVTVICEAAQSRAFRER